MCGGDVAQSPVDRACYAIVHSTPAEWDRVAVQQVREMARAGVGGPEVVRRLLHAADLWLWRHAERAAEFERFVRATVGQEGQ